MTLIVIAFCLSLLSRRVSKQAQQRQSPRKKDDTDIVCLATPRVAIKKLRLEILRSSNFFSFVARATQFTVGFGIDEVSTFRFVNCPLPSLPLSVILYRTSIQPAGPAPAPDPNFNDGEPRKTQSRDVVSEVRSLKLDFTHPVKVNVSTLNTVLSGLDTLERLTLVNVELDTPDTERVTRLATNRITRNKRADSSTLPQFSAFSATPSTTASPSIASTVSLNNNTSSDASRPQLTTAAVKPEEAKEASSAVTPPTTISAAPFALALTGSGSLDSSATSLLVSADTAAAEPLTGTRQSESATETAVPISSPSTLSAVSLAPSRKTSIPLNFSFGRIFPRLKHLLLEGVFPTASDNNAIWLRELIADLNYLEYIDLRRNQLANIPDHLFASANATLKKLYMSGNGISAIEPFGLSGLRQLEILDIFNNRITELDARLFRDLTQLAQLRMGQNSFSSLPETLFTAQRNLQTLDLSGSRNLTQLPDRLLAPLSALRNFSISDCNMTMISPHPEMFFGMAPMLEKVVLAGNRLQNLTAPQMFGRNARLNRLDIQYNDVREMSADVFSVNSNNLRELNLHGNELSYFESGTFSHLKNLRILRLGYNNFTEMPQQLLFNLRKLEELELQKNQLQSVNPQHSKLPFGLGTTYLRKVN